MSDETLIIFKKLGNFQNVEKSKNDKSMLKKTQVQYSNSFLKATGIQSKIIILNQS